ncbi:DUF1934 domain-containing protein [Metabacillus sediminilitoris]|uniref:DUF1934 family protein n=1 Tax=Metabacillus sediminilitoris TaxID=2567941 RepID=A0A4S4BQ40_9BACI|nr:DUF1934 family protein [Metabacillus sediminilitoris]QGQ48378.1 DUF1934 family protein [Metabacillus sediminilitoris]THF77034.1 DUF1934 family protein [Metabacillus sediminilitoris]
MSESTPIQLTVLSEIRNGNDDKETIEVKTTGEYVQKGKTLYIRYEEEHELGFVKTTVKIAGNEVVVMRSGAVAMKQRFSEGMVTLTDYSTPFGKLQLETKTKSLTIDTNELEGKLVILYDLQIDEKEKHVHKLVLTYKEEQK